MTAAKKTKKKPAVPKPVFSFRRNIIPPVLGVLIMGGMYVLLNAQWISAQYVYYTTEPAQVQKVAEQPAVTIAQDASEISIPTLNAKAPVIVEPSTNENAVQVALENGVVHFGGTAIFGDYGNVVVVGHSSGSPWAPGDFKTVFTLLEKVKQDDEIIVDYKGQRYIYKVTSSEVIKPTDLGVLNQPTNVRTISLITCTPVGTNTNRLVVHAEQISPVVSEDTDEVAKSEIAAPVVTALPKSATKSLLQAIKDLF